MNGERRADRYCGARTTLGTVILLCDYGPNDHTDLHWDQLWGIEWRNRTWTHESKVGVGVHEGQTTLEEQIGEMAP